MQYTTTACLILLILSAIPATGDDYSATNEHGVRVFSRVPPVGVHPRVLMSPEDLPAWREHVITTYRGRAFFAKRFVSKRIDTLAAIPPSVKGDALMAAYPNGGPGDNHDLLFATLDVIYHQDRERARQVCTAIANFARVALARTNDKAKWGEIKKDIGHVQGLSGIPAGLGHLWYRGGADFALAYDYLYEYMTEAQRDVCRKALAAATKDIVTWGMGFPRGRAISNWYGYHGELGPMLLAIEGEEGFRADQWELFRQMMRDFVEVHMYEEGGSNEDGYTGNTALREGQFTLLAMARRGENHFNAPRMRNYWKWGVLSLVPGEDTGATVSYSSAKLDPYESAPVLARWAMPGDRCVNYYLRQYKGADYSRQNRWQYAPISTLFCMNWEDSDALPLDMAKLDLPITAVFRNQGLFITRSGWSDDAAYLNLLARHDAWYDRHENVDRGRFVFAALGRRWAIDRPWGQAQASSDHSLVHIDGVAQAEAKVGRGKAPNAQLIQHGDLGGTEDAPGNAGLLGYAVIDLKNAYDWQWSHSWKQPGPEWTPETRSFVDLGWTWTRPGQPAALHGADDERSPQYGFEGCNLWRTPNNPVDYCWRTAVLVREPQPYALIVDDVRKDDQDHLYEWYMPVPDDVEFDPLRDGRILLTERHEQRTYDRADVGARRLLIVPMGPNRPTARLEEYTSSVSRTQAFMARRLVLSTRSNVGRFRVVLFPFRTTNEPAGPKSREQWTEFPLGAPIPQFSATSPQGFWMKVAGQKHEWTIASDQDGRSRLLLTRGRTRLRLDQTRGGQ